MPTRVKASIVGLGAVVALGLASVALTQTDRHLDGAGPLASLAGPGYERMAVDPAGSPSGTWTYGLRLCLASGSDPAVLHSVGPSTAVGSGFRLLGTKVREFFATNQHTGIIGVNGFPPPRNMVPDPLADVAGYSVKTACTIAPSAPYTELLVGLGLQGDDGGGWRGIEIAYSLGGRDHVLVINHDLMICGRAVDCSGPGPSVAP